MPLTLDRFIDEYPRRKQRLKKLLIEDQPIVFVGAGVGANIYPIWKKLIQELLEKAEIALSEEQNQYSDPHKAQVVKALKPEIYRQVVRGHFSRWHPTSERVLTPLDKFDLRGIITTNYDDALWRLFRFQQFRPVTINQLHARLLTEQQKYVFHIHGMIRQDDPPDAELDIILAQDEYDRHYREERLVPEFLKTAFSQHPMVFVGVSFNDQDVIEVLQEVVKLERRLIPSSSLTMPPERLALMALDVETFRKRRVLDFDFIEQKEEELKQLGITPVWFQKGDQYRGLYDLLEEWAIEVSDQRQGIPEKRPERP